MRHAADKFMDIATRVSGLYEKSFKNIRSEVILDAYSIDDLTDDLRSEIDAFHPTNVYMVEWSEDYYCGIRAANYVVEEGWSEFNDCLNYLISANHKGVRVMTMISMEL